MMSVSDIPMLLDTSVFSLFLKHNDSRAALYLPDIQDKLLAVSFVTVGELYKWAYLQRWGFERLRELEERLQKVVILSAHEEVARQWAHIQSVPGRSLPDNDAWIAACALAYGCVLVTHDRHLIDIPGISIISHVS